MDYTGPAGFVIAAAAVVTALGILWRASRSLRRHLSGRVNDWFQLQVIRAVKPMTDEVATIEHRTRELVPNGGESMADKLSRIEHGLLFHSEYSAQDRAELHRQVDDLTRRMDDEDPRR